MRLNGAVSRNNRKRVAPVGAFDGHAEESYEMSMALGARLKVQCPNFSNGLVSR